MSEQLRDLVAHAIATAGQCDHAGKDSCAAWWQADAALLAVREWLETNATVDLIAERVACQGFAATRADIDVAMCVARDLADATTVSARSEPRAQGPYRTYEDAIAVLRDDERYGNWWTTISETHPDYNYWGKGRVELADYLESIAQELPAPVTTVGGF